MEHANKRKTGIALTLVFLLVMAQASFALWPFWAMESDGSFWSNFFSPWLWREKPKQAFEEARDVFEEIEEEYGNKIAEFVKKIDKRFEESLLDKGLEGIAEIVKRFPEGNGKAVLDAMTDSEYEIWGRQTLEEIAELNEEGELANFFFKKSEFAKIGKKSVDGVARADFKDFFIETTAVRNKLTRTGFLYSKIVRQSKRFKETHGLDLTLVIVLKKGTSLRKSEIEKTVWKAFEKSSNLDMQNITRIVLYDAGKEKTVTVYSKQDWIDGKP